MTALERLVALRGTSVHRKTIEQPRTTGALQIVLTAATFGAARVMRRVPGLRRRALVEPSAVGVADNGRARPALGPIAAGFVLSWGERRSIGLRAGKDVMRVGRVAAAIHDVSLFG